ncbi:MAG: NAD(P)/FAD-dependent oxidoreductase [Candidatus Sericytochromatia bacterium]|uniref:NAD(P)/FAD-dependent oxidoreductase n=1 Tax=Candidatus Tanganyikabacteria bacterium TaxID=2961651 RepID=A0A937X539_9BACT|nr:NAD(P)/FAD-dependent oxidoreductase [Candidatus Tanganyikabacteria bacterium]
MIDRAESVIVGSGVAGSSIAWLLTRLGKRDIGVLDQRLPAGGRRRGVLVPADRGPGDATSL